MERLYFKEDEYKMKNRVIAMLVLATLIFSGACVSGEKVYAVDVQKENANVTDVNIDSQEEVDANCQMGASNDEGILFKSVPTGYEEVVHDDKFSSSIKRKGVDVSRHQGTIDWNKVKAAGVEFAIIRIGYRTYQDSGKLYVDNMAAQNIKKAKEAGIKVGVYIYSQAVTNSEGVDEADFVLKQLAGEKLDLPIVFDYEFYTDGRLEKANLSKEAGTSIANSFCLEISKNGYTPMVYANKYMLTNYLYADKISNNYKIWLANYTNKTYYAGEYSFWQFTESGKIDGINTSVDLDFWYDDIEKKSVSGELKKDENGIWRYYENGKWNSNYSGFIKKGTQWFYVKNGTIDWNYTGFAKHTDNKWYYVKNNVIDFNMTGLRKHTDGRWYYAKSGIVNFVFKGLVKKDNQWFYVKNGTIDWNYSGFVKHTDGNWYYVKNSVVDFRVNGLKKHSDGKWYYAQAGAIKFGFTGFVKRDNQWFYVRNGAIDWNYSGFGKHIDGKWYYTKNSVIDFEANGLLRHIDGKYYYTRNGMIQWYYSGNARTQDNVRMRVKNGIAIG